MSWDFLDKIGIVLGIILAIVEIFQWIYLYRISEDIDEIQDDIEDIEDGMEK